MSTGLSPREAITILTVGGTLSLTVGLAIAFALAALLRPLLRRRLRLAFVLLGCALVLLPVTMRGFDRAYGALLTLLILGLGLAFLLFALWRRGPELSSRRPLS